MRHRLPFLATLVPLRTLGAPLGMLPIEPASLVMERKLLRGIKQRAEYLATAPKSST